MRTLYLSPSTFWSELASLPDDGSDVQIKLEGGTYLYPDELQGTSVVYYGLEKKNGGLIAISAIVPGDPVFVMDWASYPLTVDYLFPNVILCAPRVHLTGLTFQGEAQDTYSSSVFRAMSWNLGARDLTGAYAVDSQELAVVDCRWSGGYTTILQLLPSRNPLTYTEVSIQDLSMTDIGFPAMRISGNGSSFPQYSNIRADNIVCSGRSFYSTDESSWQGTGDAWSSSTPRSHGITNPPIWCEINDLGGSSTVTIHREDCVNRVYSSINHDMHCMRYNRILSADVRITHRDGRYRGEWLDGLFGGNASLPYYAGGGIGALWYYHGGGPTYATEGSRPRIDFENFTFERYVAPGVGDLAEIDVGGGVDLGMVWCNSSADYHFWDCKLTSEIPSYFVGTKSYPQKDFRFGLNPVSFWRHSTPKTPDGTIASESWIYSDDESRGYTDKNWKRKLTVKKFSPPKTNLLSNPTFVGGFVGGWSTGSPVPSVADGVVTLTHSGAVGVGFWQDITNWQGAPTLYAYLEFWHTEGDARALWFEISARNSGGTIIDKYTYNYRPDTNEIYLGYNPTTTDETYAFTAPNGWTTAKVSLPIPANTATVRWSCTNGTNVAVWGGSGSYPVTYLIRNPILTDA